MSETIHDARIIVDGVPVAASVTAEWTRAPSVSPGELVIVSQLGGTFTGEFTIEGNLWNHSVDSTGRVWRATSLLGEALYVRPSSPRFRRDARRRGLYPSRTAPGWHAWIGDHELRSKPFRSLKSAKRAIERRVEVDR